MRSLFAGFVCCFALSAESPPRIPAPLYTPSSIVNGASFKVGALAPNTIGTLYGRDLAFATRSLGPDDLYNGTLPTTLLGSGVRLLINRTLAYIYFVSPGQVNFLVPSTLTPGRVEIQLGVDGRYGEAVQVTLTEFSPALFQLDPETALATRVDGTVVSGDKPARPGDVVILYATGLGATRPRLPAGQIPSGAAWLDKIADFQVFIAGQAVNRTNILYAGAAPGFAGLYQINLRLPSELGNNPELRIGFGDVLSPANVRLPIYAGNQ
ncbi:MAG TPA: hypothetical protein VEX68_20200 [Bryobacteraceae bacterium]|nr:hypothetical protein [Bryobacteraceae bacterium]